MSRYGCRPSLSAIPPSVAGVGISGGGEWLVTGGMSASAAVGPVAPNWVSFWDAVAAARLGWPARRGRESGPSARRRRLRSPVDPGAA